MSYNFVHMDHNNYVFLRLILANLISFIAVSKPQKEWKFMFYIYCNIGMLGVFIRRYCYAFMRYFFLSQINLIFPHILNYVTNQPKKYFVGGTTRKNAFDPSYTRHNTIKAIFDCFYLFGDP